MANNRIDFLAAYSSVFHSKNQTTINRPTNCIFNIILSFYNHLVLNIATSKFNKVDCSQFTLLESIFTTTTPLFLLFSTLFHHFSNFILLDSLVFIVWLLCFNCVLQLLNGHTSNELKGLGNCGIDPIYI